MSDARDDATRKAILARRARFVAAAVAGVGLAACEPAQGPHVCLDVAPNGPTAQRAADAGAADATDEADSAAGADAGTGTDARATSASTAPPMPCLSVLPPPRDAGLPPMVCLSMLPPARDAGPQPCLKVAPGPNDEP